MATQNGTRNFTVEDRFQAIGETSGWKHKYRSVLVGARINGKGNLGFFTTYGNSNTGYFNPNEPGSRIGVDGDGVFPTNCVYEREDEFLEWCQNQGMDEIILYGIAEVLSKGNKQAIDFTPNPNGPILPYFNVLQEIQEAEWHIARFVRKAKTEYNLHVVTVLGNKSGNADEFYDFQDEYSRSGYQEMIGDLTDAFFERYISLWLLTPEKVTYLDYEDDTLFFLKDAQGRISMQDKLIKDTYNHAVYEFRLRNNYIQAPESPCTTLPKPDVRCEMNFDAYMIEWEWWNNSSSAIDAEFDDMKLYLRSVKKKLMNESWTCKPELYVFQNDFGVSANYTEQQRADSIDKWADRIYLYSYRKNPCDGYWGNASGVLRKKFFHKVQLLANNNFGSAGGRTVILPVFNAKYYNNGRALAANYPNPNYTEHYNDQRFDCEDIDGDGVIQIRECDFCQNYTGHFLNDLKNYNPSWSGAWSFNSNLGYTENIFQDQYDFDQNNFNNGSNNNIIFGYAWLKFSLLYENDFINNIDVKQIDARKTVQIYPNPTNGIVRIESVHQVHSVRVYDLSGKLLQNHSINSNDNQLLRLPQQSGLFILKVESNEATEVFKIQVQ